MMAIKILIIYDRSNFNTKVRINIQNMYIDYRLINLLNKCCSLQLGNILKIYLRKV